MSVHIDQQKLNDRKNINQILSKKHKILLSIMIDFMLDPATVNTLRQALDKQQPFDIIRMLAHQWNKNLSTLSHDINTEHDYILSIAYTKNFIEALAKELLIDAKLRTLNEEIDDLKQEAINYIQTNQPLHAAWCVILLWKKPRYKHR